MLEDDLSNAERNRQVGERRFTHLLPVDPDFGPRLRVDVHRSMRIQLEVLDLSRVDVHGLFLGVVQVPIRQLQLVMARAENDLILARAERLAVLGDVDDDGRRDGGEAREDRDVERNRLAGFDPNGSFHRARAAEKRHDVSARRYFLQCRRRLARGLAVEQDTNACRLRRDGDFTGRWRLFDNRCLL